MNPHDDMDDTADFAVSRFGKMPGEASSERGFEDAGCGSQGEGMGPWGWLVLGIFLTCGAAALAVPWLAGL